MTKTQQQQQQQHAHTLTYTPAHSFCVTAGPVQYISFLVVVIFDRSDPIRSDPQQQNSER